ncbi:MAG: hypothetical protein HWD85_05655 [Flavobacteriaceae bacterium]|nr:hypothetical protein [Flavobacteriaceae bacterium]
MKHLKTFLYLCLIGFFIWSCSSVPKKTNTTKEEPVVIANDSLEYEIIIIDVGFTAFLNSEAKPKTYLSESYLKNKNQRYVTEWNARVRNPQRYNPNIYENIIDYNPNLNYGLDVNYKLYWYFKFAEKKYRMRLE